MMDRCCALVAVVAALVGADSVRGDGPGPIPPKPVSRVASKASADDLRKVANDPEAKRADRAAAVFALFANHVAPPVLADAAADALGEVGWLADARVQKIVLLAGWVPVNIGPGSSTFDVALFPDKDGYSEWRMCLRLSGPDHSDDGLRKFLAGGTLARSPKLVEFALSYPPRIERGRNRIERFNDQGMTVVRTDD